MRPLQEYGLLGNTRTAALVASDGTIDWLCFPRFDSGACFAALLGEPRHGRWALAPRGSSSTVGRAYRQDSLVLETRMACAAGEMRIVDCMHIRDFHADLVRRVEGVRGRVPMRMVFNPRFDYGSVIPWIRVERHRLHALAGPDHLTLDTDLELEVHDSAVSCEFSVAEGSCVDLRLAWTPSAQQPPERIDVGDAIDETTRWWQDWASRCRYRGEYREAVLRSLITLKALTYAPSGGIIAAPTTSLPEELGGVRNGDYRFCWIRDATFTLMALLSAGYVQEARQWREWLLRAVAGSPRQLQIMYGLDGERRMPEFELGWLPGYAGSRPVQVGNEAASQFQLDVFGELMDALHLSRTNGIPPDPDAWRVQRTLMDFLESNWTEPDNGIWEMRGPRRHFTHSKVMAWAAIDRAIKDSLTFRFPGPIDRWKRMRADIFDEVCEKGYDVARSTFTQYFGSRSLDAAVLTLPDVGFLAAEDDRMRGTVAAVERELCEHGLVRRYSTGRESRRIDGLPPGEGSFIACTFWLADNYAQRGDTARGRAVFEKVLALRNDLGLLAEQYSYEDGSSLGNFPQALSHIALINTALNLMARPGSEGERSTSRYPTSLP
ncbi:glycoside hydrolase 15-related [Saccharopolyspora erythraea NRRL 2338]|uniref:Glycoside hydrolase 15-related n=1 Tax=Saccharopolyspora erythraea (strain ATCC 11635 / DSM 40517 / JCM 4748 / NBRC 13426 / NCIMB 8594 / NRRL 2338) TaxID=405948 RepID=A4FCK5_SACEN|nr:glycoside hydrolase 15-related [Saccharopolyspora erythraea NRRL 2338]